MIPQTRSTGLIRYSETDLTQTEYAVTPGLFLAASLPAGIVQMAGFRGIGRLRFTGTGAANRTYRAWLLGVLQERNARRQDHAALTYTIERLVELNITLGARQYSAQSPHLASHFVADTITVVGSKSAYLEHLEDLYQRELIIASPADDGSAYVSLPDAGDLWGWMIDWDRDAGGGTAATAMNALYSMGT